MKYFGYLCLGGYEVANEDRVAAYIRAGLLPDITATAHCEECPALLDYNDVDYSDPAFDDAPWYDSNFPDSADFLGLLPLRIEVPSSIGRTMNARAGDGGVLSPLRLSPRILTFEGLLHAASDGGMAYGERWLNEVLGGAYCVDGCEGDEAVVLPVCPDFGYAPVEQAFRQLVGVGVVDPPVISPLGSFPEGRLSQVTFQLAAAEPYLFGLAERMVTANLPASAAGAYTTPDWVDGAAFVIDITNDGTVNATNIVVTGRVSLDGSCPVTGTASSVPPSWTYTIPTMRPGDRIVIDGRKRKVTYYDASDKRASAGLSYVTFEGPWKNPEVGPCTTMCVTASIGSGGAALTIDGHLRWR